MLPLLFPGAFVICWTPGLVILLLDGLNCSDCKILEYEKYCLVLAECNSLVNPIIYSRRDKDMRDTFESILCFVCKRGKGQERDTSNIQSGTLNRVCLLSEKSSEPNTALTRAEP